MKADGDVIAPKRIMPTRISTPVLVVVTVAWLFVCAGGCADTAEERGRMTDPSGPVQDAPYDVAQTEASRGAAIERVSLHTPAFAWRIDFFPDGSVAAQYGSLPGDGAKLPAGTVDFSAVVAEVQRQQTDERIEGGAQAAIWKRGETSVKASYLKEDALFRELFQSVDNQWVTKFEVRSGRFDELRKAYPIYD